MIPKFIDQRLSALPAQGRRKRRRIIWGRLLVFIFGTLIGLAQASDVEQLENLRLEVRQAIVVKEDSSGSIHARLARWERRNGKWMMAAEGMEAVLGRNGLAPEDKKREGDGRTPAGIYKLGPAFGYAPAIGTGLNYRQSTDNNFWVDDPASKQYNQWVTGQPAARSFEPMKRSDDLYQYGIVIQYNTNPIVPGRGSAIFLHVWRDSNSPTAGCVAVSKDNILKILHWLDASKKPVVIIQ